MGDVDKRDLERAYLAGDPAAGEAWVRAELRDGGAPVLLMVALSLKQSRVLDAIIDTVYLHPGQDAMETSAARIREACAEPITPQAIVDFIRAQDRDLTALMTPTTRPGPHALDVIVPGPPGVPFYYPEARPAGECLTCGARGAAPCRPGPHQAARVGPVDPPEPGSAPR